MTISKAKAWNVQIFAGMFNLLFIRSRSSPIALFVAVMFVYNRLITDSELIVMKAVGISSILIARAAVIMGSLLVICNMWCCSRTSKIVKILDRPVLFLIFIFCIYFLFFLN